MIAKIGPLGDPPAWLIDSNHNYQNNTTFEGRLDKAMTKLVVDMNSNYKLLYGAKSMLDDHFHGPLFNSK